MRCIITYKYDAEGRRTERIIEYPSGKVSHQGYEYNAQGQQSRLIYYSWETGEVIQYWQHSYDDKGNKVLAELYHFPDEFVAKSIYEYDENNQMLKETRYDAEGNLVYEKMYE
ncbi:MAG: hypothetical protein IJF07_07740 [Lachnospiraceae bacterium]|nr:hypothetical protein [Lachnospiraceae bacterium]